MNTSTSISESFNAKLLYSTFWQNQGPINVVAAQNQVQSLNGRRPTDDISFSEKNIGARVDDGVCTAHCLSFLSIYLRSFRNEILTQAITRRHKPFFKSWDDRVIKCLNACPNDTEIRTNQAALNTITKISCSELSLDDFLEAKVASLCALKALKVLSASPNLIDFNNKSENENKKAFFQIFDDLEAGAHILRGICSIDNQGNELYGHSMALIKTEFGSYFFDPSSMGGLAFIKKEREKEYIYDFVKFMCDAFWLKYPRFYKLKAVNWAIRPIQQQTVESQPA